LLFAPPSKPEPEFDLSIRSGEELEQALLEVSRDNTQLLLNKVFALPTASVDVGVLAQLPKPTTHLPREKPVPVPKPLTRWEKFAKDKGIHKTKRSRLEFDDESGEYLPRYGSGSKKNDPMQDWAIPIPNRPGQGTSFGHGFGLRESRMRAFSSYFSLFLSLTLFCSLFFCISDFDEDPREKKQAEKKQRVEKQEKQRKRNIEEAAAALGKTVATTSGAPYKKGSRNEERKKALEKTLSAAKLSTPGLGVHGTQLEGDKKIAIKRKRQVGFSCL
jgi:regulator of ribosome biosynthesis